MQKFQVSFLGLSTLFGKTCSLLLKQSPFIKCIKLYDEYNIDPALDVAGLNTQCKVKAFLGKEQLKPALKDADIIVIGEDAATETASTTDPFPTSAPKILDYAKAIAATAPEAIVVIAASPVNSLIPLLTQTLVQHGCHNSNKILGATTVDNIRANSILAKHLNADARNVVLPVIGGSSEETRVPVFSQARPYKPLSQNVKTEIIKGVKRGDTQIKKINKCPESLNKAYAITRFVNSVMAGLRGEPNITDITLTKTNSVPGVDYFALPVTLGRHGVSRRFGIPRLTDMEQEMVNKAIQSMKKDVEKASVFYLNSKSDFNVLQERKEAVGPQIGLPKDVTNVDTKPQKLLPYHTQDNPFNNENFDSNMKEKAIKIINPLDRLLAKSKLKEDNKINAKLIETKPTPEPFLKTSVIKEVLIEKEELSSKNKKLSLLSLKVAENDTKQETQSKITEIPLKTPAEPKVSIKKLKIVDGDDKPPKMTKPTKGSEIKEEKSVEKIKFVKKFSAQNKTFDYKLRTKSQEGLEKVAISKEPKEKLASKLIAISKEPKDKLPSKQIAISKEPIDKLPSKLIAFNKELKEKFPPKHMKQESVLLQALKLQRIAENQLKNKAQSETVKPIPPRIKAKSPPHKPETKLPALAKKKPMPQKAKKVDPVKKEIVYDLTEIEKPLKAYLADDLGIKPRTEKAVEVAKPEEKSQVLDAKPEIKAEEASKISPSTPKSLPSTPKNVSSTSKNVSSTPKMAPSSPKSLPSTPKNVSSTSKNVSSTPKMAPSTPKMAPSTPKMAPSTPKSLPSTPKNVSSTSKNVSSTPKMAPSTPKVASPIKGVQKNDIAKIPDFIIETSNKGKNLINDYAAGTAKPFLSMQGKDSSVRMGHKFEFRSMPNHQKTTSLLQMITAQQQARRNNKCFKLKEVKKDNIEVKKPFKNLLQSLPSTRKNFLKPKDKLRLAEEAKKQAELEEQKLKAEEANKKVIIIKDDLESAPEINDEVNPVVQSVQKVDEIKVEPKEEPKEVQSKDEKSEIQPKTLTPLRILQNNQNGDKVDPMPRHTAGDKLNLRLKHYFKRHSGSHRFRKPNISTSGLLSKKSLLHQLNKPRVVPKTMEINKTKPFSNVSLIKDGHPEFKNVLTMLNYGPKEKELSKSFRQSIKEKNRVRVSFPIRTTPGIKIKRKERKNKNKTLLHFLTTPKKEVREIHIKKIKIPAHVKFTLKQESEQFHSTLRTGTCSDFIRSTKNPYLQRRKNYESIPFISLTSNDVKNENILTSDFKLNEYTCKSSMLPSLKFLKDLR